MFRKGVPIRLVLRKNKQLKVAVLHLRCWNAIALTFADDLVILRESKRWGKGTFRDNTRDNTSDSLEEKTVSHASMKWEEVLWRLVCL